MGMNSTGEITRPSSVQRASASKPQVRPVASDTMGW
jgi:hypothetical protein